MKRGSRARTWTACIAVAMALALAAPLAHADGLTSDEATRLDRGETVTREQTLERGDGRYVGGVTYTVLEATPRELDALFDDVSAYERVLPRTKSARFAGTTAGDSLIELHQGTSLFETEYTIRVKRDPAGRSVKFWLDPSRPHGIDDAWGFFRVEPLTGNRVLLTYGALVDMGDGIGRALFEERVRHAMLSVPQRLRAYLAELRSRGDTRYALAR